MRELCFTITGEAITTLAREKYKLTASIAMGVVFLKEALVEFPEELAVKVLTGKAKFVGNGTSLKLQDDNAEVRPYIWPKPSDPSKVVCGWIAPNGEIFGHRTYNNINDHRLIAQDLVERGYVSVDENEYHDEEATLEMLGFLKFSPCYLCCYVKPSSVTIEQKKCCYQAARKPQFRLPKNFGRDPKYGSVIVRQFYSIITIMKNKKVTPAKTTEGLIVGMHIKFKDGKNTIESQITYIFDRWSVGTLHGSVMADAIIA